MSLAFFNDSVECDAKNTFKLPSAKPMMLKEDAANDIQTLGAKSLNVLVT